MTSIIQEIKSFDLSIITTITSIILVIAMILFLIVIGGK